ncbi:hypothetical protein [Amycolatopsis sp. CA-230715]|uniref:hypothetical protein n=1 Tax=Amycolatopsis sp. CA-230715 TaxID=2745196 RepID=UPI001C01A6BA|nr:hypothetical protein [Amycolatopsis sp. CA-230715]QWF80923.1 hypothetical protein HUW46_04348 [Amycolatopsis sp. CA-230715]
MRNRPAAQWTIGGVAALCVLYALTKWVEQLMWVLTGCAGGFGNPGTTGELTGGYCVLSGRGPLLELPWREDLWITVLLGVGLACLGGAAWVRRRSTLVASLAIPVLLYAGFSMASRGHQRADGHLVRYLANPVDGVGWDAVPNGWELNLTGGHLFVPDIGMAPLGVTMLGGLAVLVLVALRWYAPRPAAGAN